MTYIEALKIINDKTCDDKCEFRGNKCGECSEAYDMLEKLCLEKDKQEEGKNKIRVSSGSPNSVAKVLVAEEFEQMLDDLQDEDYRYYLDTWDYEDEYSNNDIDDARTEFIMLANNYFEENNLDLEAREVNENVYLFDTTTGERLYN